MRAWQLVRAGGGPPNPQTITQRARTFAAAATPGGSVTLATLRDDMSMRSFVVMPDAHGAGEAAVHLAQTLAARAEPVAEPPELDAAVFGVLVARSGQVASRDSQAGTDPSEVARRLSVSMRPGSWVAASMRAPKRSEVRRVRRWYEHRLGTRLPVHHTSDDQAVVMSLIAGGASADEVKSLLAQVAASLPGFDIDTKVKVVTLARSVAPWTGATIVSWAAGLVVSGGDPLVAGVAGLPAALLAAGTSTGRLPSVASSLSRAAHHGHLAAPARRSWPPRSPRRGNPEPPPGVGAVAPSDGDYPLAPSAFLVGPSVPVGLVAPHAGASSGAAQTERRSAPSLLLEDIGPGIGTAGEGELVHVSAADGWSGLGIIGQAGSGKSAVLRSVWGWHCLEHQRPRGVAGWPGASNALIAFDAKPDGAAAMVEWAAAAGERAVLVDVADPESWGIDIFAVPGSASERAAFLANALVYTFGSDAIGDRSYETLTNMLTAALLVTPEMARAAGVEAGLSPFALAHVLCGGLGDGAGVALATEFALAAAEAEREAGSRSLPSGESDAPSSALTELGKADARLSPYYGGRTSESARRNLTEAARNKLSQLVEVEGFWSPKRRSFSWDAVLDGHRAVIVNTGVATSGATISERGNAQVASLLLFALRDAIVRRCSGWQAAGRSVTVFADELALIAGASPEVISWLRNQGRSYGVRPIFATQYPEQLLPAVRTAFLGFGTLLWFAQNDVGVVAEAAADLSLDGGEWTPAEIAGLEPFVAVLRSTVRQHRQPAVAVRLSFWESDIAGYAEAQGWR